MTAKKSARSIPQDQILLSTAEVAVVLGISVGTVRAMRASGQLPEPASVGNLRHPRYRRAEIVALIDKAISA